ncbi:hypothetical protein ACROYT_G015075 [Oculina patagonica]
MAKLNKRVWNNDLLSERTKLQVYRSCVLSTLLYESESWPHTPDKRSDSTVSTSAAFGVSFRSNGRTVFPTSMFFNKPTYRASLHYSSKDAYGGSVMLTVWNPAACLYGELWKGAQRMASFLVVLLVLYDGILLDEHQLQHVTSTANASYIPICWGKDGYNDRMTAFDRWWLTFLAMPLCLFICNAAVIWSWKPSAPHGCELRLGRQGGGSAKFKVNVTGGHVHILCGDNSKMDVADKGGCHARIHTMSARSSDAKITGPDQLVSAIPYRVYFQLTTMLARDIVNVAGRLFNLTLEEAMSLMEITACDHSSADAVFQLMKERHVNLGQLVQVLEEMQRFDVLNVLTEAGYPDHPEQHPNVLGAAKNFEDGKVA